MSGPACPRLRVEVAAGRRLWLRQSGEVVLFGRQRAGCLGVWYARTGRYRSPLPAMRAAEARRLRAVSADDDVWASRWTHRFVDWLQSAPDGPLHSGGWTLAWGMPSWSAAARWRRLPDGDRDRGHISWFGYGVPVEHQRDVLPLRRLSALDAGRVRSYRRQLREGIVAPVLLWWVSGLQVMLVLDGHDRIAAALAEDVVPEVVVLAPAADPASIAAVQQHQIRGYVGRAAHFQQRIDRGDGLAAGQLASVSRSFAAQLGDLARSEGRTRAWPVAGGAAVWDQQVASMAPDWSPGEGAAGVGQAGREHSGSG